MSKVLVDFEDLFDDKERVIKRANDADQPLVTWAVNFIEAALDREEKAGEPYMQEMAEKAESSQDLLEDVEGGGRAATMLIKNEVETVHDVLDMTAEEIIDVDGIGQKSARQLAEALQEGGYIDNADDLIPTEETEEEEEAEEDEEDASEEETEEEESVVEAIDNVEATKEGFKKAASLLRDALMETGMSEDEVKDQVREIAVEHGYPKEKYGEAIKGLREAVPMTDEQREKILALSDEYDIDKKTLKVDEPSAAFGKPLDELNYQEADDLYEKLQEEYQEMPGDEVELDDSDIFDDV